LVAGWLRGQLRSQPIFSATLTMSLSTSDSDQTPRGSVRWHYVFLGCNRSLIQFWFIMDLCILWPSVFSLTIIFLSVTVITPFLALLFKEDHQWLLCFTLIFLYQFLHAFTMINQQIICRLTNWQFKYLIISKSIYIICLQSLHQGIVWWLDINPLSLCKTRYSISSISSSILDSHALLLIPQLGFYEGLLLTTNLKDSNTDEDFTRDLGFSSQSTKKHFKAEETYHAFKLRYDRCQLNLYFASKIQYLETKIWFIRKMLLNKVFVNSKLVSDHYILYGHEKRVGRQRLLAPMNLL
jgi:hypothetical protein